MHLNALWPVRCAGSSCSDASTEPLWPWLQCDQSRLVRRYLLVEFLDSGHEKWHNARIFDAQITALGVLRDNIWAHSLHVLSNESLVYCCRCVVFPCELDGVDLSSLLQSVSMGPCSFLNLSSLACAQVEFSAARVNFWLLRMRTLIVVELLKRPRPTLL